MAINTMNQMQVYRASAFSDSRGLEGKPVSGNPAGIVMCRNGLPDAVTMKKMAVEVNEPIVAFLSQREEKHFDLKFYFPDGEDCFLCGHGTLASAYFINKLFDYEDISLRIDGHELVLNCKVDTEKKVKAYLKPYHLDPMPADKIDTYFSLLGLRRDDVQEQFYSPDLNDCILVLKDCKQLRSLSPDYKQLSAQIKQDHLRAIMVTAASLNEEIDYEIRIFCPYVEEDEDISCGSANCYLLPYWKKTLHKENERDELVILCPFKPVSGSFGGIEHGNFYATDHLVSISGKIHEI